MASDADSWEGAENYLRAVMEGMRKIEGWPMLVVAQTKQGPVTLIATDFPHHALPTMSEWINLYPARREGRSFRITVEGPTKQRGQ